MQERWLLTVKYEYTARMFLFLLQQVLSALQRRSLFVVLSMTLVVSVSTILAFSPCRPVGRTARQPRWLSSMAVVSEHHHHHHHHQDLDHQQQQAQAQDAMIECFIVNYFDMQEGLATTPHVVCTSQPDEYAWYHGIDRATMMKKTDGILQGALECVEGASPRGIPEWECRTTLQESSWQ